MIWQKRRQIMRDYMNSVIDAAGRLFTEIEYAIRQAYGHSGTTA